MGQQYQQKQENDFNEGSVLKIMKKEEIQAGKLVWLWCTSGVCSIWWVEEDEEGRGEGGRGRKRRRKLAGIFFGELCCALCRVGVPYPGGKASCRDQRWASPNPD